MTDAAGARFVGGTLLVMASALAVNAAMDPSRTVQDARARVDRISASLSGEPETPASLPTLAVIDVCNQLATRTGARSMTVDMRGQGFLGAALAASVGAVDGARADDVPYGLAPERTRDRPYRVAYANCLRRRGYAT